MQIIQGVDKIVEQSQPDVLVRKAQGELEQVVDYFLNTWPQEASGESKVDKFQRLDDNVWKLYVNVQPALYYNNCSDGREWPTFMLGAGLQVQAVQEMYKRSYLTS